MPGVAVSFGRGGPLTSQCSSTMEAHWEGRTRTTGQDDERYHSVIPDVMKKAIRLWGAGKASAQDLTGLWLRDGEVLHC